MQLSKEDFKSVLLHFLFPILSTTTKKAKADFVIYGIELKINPYLSHNSLKVLKLSYLTFTFLTS